MKVAAVGEILVEMVARTPGAGFGERQEFLGPFPSGAPAIFIDQIARMGVPCTIFGAVGHDDFGRVNIDRLATDGVDTSNIVVVPNLPTGIAFVRYTGTGGRNFLFTLRGSASELIPDHAAPDIIDGITHLHVMGSSLGVPRVAVFVEHLAARVKQNGGTISLDPNLRVELLAEDPTLAVDCLRRLALAADFLLPSEGELSVLMDGIDDEARIKALLALGIPEIVLKRGAAGAIAFTASDRIAMPAPLVEEADPTGAGDCFGATYVARRLSGDGVAMALRYAVVAGAHSVTQIGPMEGTIKLASLEALIRDGQAGANRPSSTQVLDRPNDWQPC